MFDVCDVRSKLPKTDSDRTHKNDANTPYLYIWPVPLLTSGSYKLFKSLVSDNSKNLHVLVQTLF